MDEITYLKKTYQDLSLEIESLKTKKTVLINRLNNLKIRCEMKKTRLEFLRRKYFISQKDCHSMQQDILSLKDKNKKIQEDLAFAEELRYSLENEIENETLKLVL